MSQFLKIFGINAGTISSIDSFSFSFKYSFEAFLLAVLFMLPLTLYFCRFEGKPVKLAVKRKLLLIRALWVILISALAAGPILTISGLVPDKSRIAVLIDTSKSMGIKNKTPDGNEISRLDNVKALLKNNFLSDIEAKTSVQPDVFAFSDNIAQLSNQEIEKLDFYAEGNQTNITEAIRNISGNLGGSSLLGVILLTDGTHTAGGSVLNEAVNMKTPLHFVMPDEEKEKRDISVSLSNPPSVAYLNSGIRVKGEIGLYGSASSPIKIEVTCDNRPYSIINAEIKNGERKAEFALNIPCYQEGNFKYEFKVPPVQGELTEDNNSAGFLLKVVKERLNILAISGNPSWELKFMANAAMSDPNAHFTYICKLFGNKWAKSVDMKPEPATDSPNFLTAIKDADVIVLNGVEFNDLRPVEAEITKRVESGLSGLLVMASNAKFSKLGYIGSNISNLFPVGIDEEKETSNIGSFIIPSGQTEYSFLKVIDDSYQNEKFFASLPKLEKISEFGEEKPIAEVLLSVESNNKKSNIPYMIKSRYGRGNTVMLTGGPLWYSGFKLVPTDIGFTSYSAMIVNMFKFLANRHEDSQISIETSNGKNVVGSPSSVRVWVSDSKRQLLNNAQTTLTAINSNNEKVNIPCLETSEKGCYEGAFVPTEKGIWKIEAEASYRGKLLGKSSIEMLVEIPTSEFDDPSINKDVMQKAAELTGGMCVYAKDSGKLISSLTSATGEKMASKGIDLRDSWLFLLLVLALPAIEWYIRRTGGLS